MTDSGGSTRDGAEGTRLPLLCEKLQLLMKVRRRADGSPFRGATDIRNDLLTVLDGPVTVNRSVSMIAKVINGKQPNPGPELIAGLAALFRVPSDFLLPAVTREQADQAATLYTELQALAAGPANDEQAESVVDATVDQSWVAVADGLVRGVKRVTEAIAHELDLSPRHAEALRNLATTVSVSMDEMAHLCETTVSTASRTADVLEAKGLLEPHPRHGESRKVRRLALTSTAREVVARHASPSGSMQTFLDGATSEDLKMMQDLLATFGGMVDPAGQAENTSARPAEHHESPVRDSGQGVA